MTQEQLSFVGSAIGIVLALSIYWACCWIKDQWYLWREDMKQRKRDRKDKDAIYAWISKNAEEGEAK